MRKFAVTDGPVFITFVDGETIFSSDGEKPTTIHESGRIVAVIPATLMVYEVPSIPADEVAAVAAAMAGE